MSVCGNDGDVISFRVVDKARKREYVVAASFTIAGARPWFDSHEFNLTTKEEYDSDGDGMCDYWEWFHGESGFNPTAWNNPGNDSDGDGLTDIQEYDANTSPAAPDTDGDGYFDYVEINSGSDPNDPGDTPGMFRINFAPSGSARAAGYLEDSGLDDTGSGFGWKPE